MWIQRRRHNARSHEHARDSPNPWPGRSVFVTGAYGLLGGWLVKALAAPRRAGDRAQARRGERTRRSSLEGTERRVNVVHGDVSDGALLERR